METYCVNTVSLDLRLTPGKTHNNRFQSSHLSGITSLQLRIYIILNTAFVADISTANERQSNTASNN